MKKTIIILSCISVVAISCNDVAEYVGQADVQNGDVLTEITAVMPQIEMPESTRVGLENENSTWHFSWSAGTDCDVLGFLPADPGNYYYKYELMQSLFYVSEVSEEGDRARFKADGWGLLTGKRYYSYYPYSETTEYHKVDIDYDGQYQFANDDINHLGDKLFLYADTGTVTGGNQDVMYFQLGCLCIFEFTLPSEYLPCEITSMTLSVSNQEGFTHKAHYDPCCSNPPMSIVKDETSGSFEMDMNVRTDDEGKVTVYAMMNPDLSSGTTVTATLESYDGNLFSGSYTTGSDQHSGESHLYKSNLSFSGRTEINLSRRERANCYMVTSSGSYKFLAARCGDETALPEIATVELLWGQSSIIENLCLTDGYVKFTTTDNGASFNRGNAVIVGKNSVGTVVWSWHIWFTDKPSNQTFPNGAGTLMDRNLGASAPWSEGLYYQWGRKDPFEGNKALTIAANNGDKDVSYSIQHPSTFISADMNNSLDWNKDSKDKESNLWNDGLKSVYDPCPPGYKVPEGGSASVTGFFRTAYGDLFHIGYDHNTGKFAGTEIGWTKVEGKDCVYMPVTGGYAYLPETGYYAEPSGQWETPIMKTVFLWTGSGSGRDGLAAWNTWTSGLIDIHEYLTFDWNSGRAAGKNLRCRKISGSEVLESKRSNEKFRVDHSEW